MAKRMGFINALINPLLVTIALLLAIDHWQHIDARDLILLAILFGLGFRIGRS